MVDSASSLVKKLNIPNIVIGLTIVSFGTSAPELIVNIFSSITDNSDIALGNIVGSNIFNIFFILGISAVINPISLHKMSNLDMACNIFVSALLFLFIFTGKGRRLERWEGIIFISIYIFYVITLIIL